MFFRLVKITMRVFEGHCDFTSFSSVTSSIPKVILFMMSTTRPITPPLLENRAQFINEFQTSFTAFSNLVKEGSVITGPQNTQVPPSPGATTFTTSDHGLDQATTKLRANTGAGIKHTRAEQRRPFRFLALPGEIRNLIYDHTQDDTRQALLVHRPRLASLRSRTRVDRSRPLASEVAGHEHDKQLELVKSFRSMHTKKNTGGLSRESHRPFFGLTQVCKAIRQEFRPIYLRYQEIGMDLTEIVKYLRTFYADAPQKLATIAAPGVRKQDLSYTGNLTIAVSDRPNMMERGAHGIDIFPLLDIWANSWKIEAGFGRYMKARYYPEADGEAKDLYRLFGRRVLPTRSCSDMNTLWRTILRTRAVAAVFVHRAPTSPLALSTEPTRALPQLAQRRAAQHPLAGNGAYIHIVFKKDTAEPWMTSFESDIPTGWLADRGFYNMDFFEMRVGVEESHEHHL
ncbi:hypothetical protein LEMA_P002720.1 [Plenodomus lingam JN3]|uniref:F-box domain-containing protein n=1 Tax=Leptosphaeria maculans (strain JN3 / isolate v23.1.3 / race Av1-4-5-6-7-8) TaxID=985895 RepID=E5AE46_LEPMJ|nr:hypothetical protein LEMA_P002720.1 [Plenodomus lingam JN3]CBY01485.1 hypothetical protein LEMA_P002720.1 [Plenodomus lingam JN3]